MTRALIVPGLFGSGPEHWQTQWEALDARCVRVQQEDWDHPDLAAWCAALERAVAAQPEPVILVAHSLGCVLVAHWAQRGSTLGVRGALLVAPADVESSADLPELALVRGFCPIPTAQLPFPSIVAASRNDPYASVQRAAELARRWGARLVDLGDVGHVNADSKLGTWPVGRELLRELLGLAPFTLDPRLRHDTVQLGESEGSLLLLMNERRYPWLILVPKRPALSELYELAPAEQASLLEESCLVAQVLAAEFQADKVNVGALGNVVRQLHLHHVARWLGDPAWPGPVWGHSPRQPYSPEELASVRARLAKTALSTRFLPND
jgi:predicted alpha/beta hydrolase family esterase/diadenosine tetraphosphate (Ap4A) HIT family hydrolase